MIQIHITHNPSTGIEYIRVSVRVKKVPHLSFQIRLPIPFPSMVANISSSKTGAYTTRAIMKLANNVTHSRKLSCLSFFVFHKITRTITIKLYNPAGRCVSSKAVSSMPAITYLLFQSERNTPSRNTIASSCLRKPNHARHAKIGDATIRAVAIDALCGETFFIKKYVNTPIIPIKMGGP